MSGALPWVHMCSALGACAGPGRWERTAATQRVRSVKASSASKGDISQGLQFAAQQVFTPEWETKARASGDAFTCYAHCPGQLSFDVFVMRVCVFQG